MSSIVKIIITVLVLAGVGFFGYNYLTRTSVPSGVLLQQESADTSKMGAEVLTALNQLRTLKLDSSIFSDKTYLSLEDFSKPLNPEPVGRINPFSPIGVENYIPGKTVPAPKTASTSTSTVQTQTPPNNAGVGN
jgi:hypothetical protein